MAENCVIVIQAKNITLPVFSTTTIFGMLGVSWQLYYCLLCTKRVFLEPFGKSYLHYLRPYTPNEFPKNAAFVFIFECFVLRQSLYENDPGRVTFRLSKYGMVGVS